MLSQAGVGYKVYGFCNVDGEFAPITDIFDELGDPVSTIDKVQSFVYRTYSGEWGYCDNPSFAYRFQ